MNKLLLYLFSPSVDCYKENLKEESDLTIKNQAHEQAQVGDVEQARDRHFRRAMYYGLRAAVGYGVAGIGKCLTDIGYRTVDTYIGETLSRIAGPAFYLTGLIVGLSFTIPTFYYLYRVFVRPLS